MRHSIYLTDDQWKIFQDLSGQRNPASYVRQVLDKFIRHSITSTPTEGIAPKSLAGINEIQRVHDRARELLDERWAKLGCAFRKFDDFNKARRWYVNQFGSEDEALTELEERHAKEGLLHPRAWLYRHWRNAGAPTGPTG
jgi:hypothetical protein